DCVGVLQQHRSRGREAQPAGLALEQSGADLPLERSDLVGHRWLRERELASGGGVGPLVRVAAEREHAARIHSKMLSSEQKHYWKLWMGSGTLIPMSTSTSAIPAVELNDGNTIPQL